MALYYGDLLRAAAYHYVAKCDNKGIITFPDDTTLIGLISDSDEKAYRRKVEDLVRFSQKKSLFTSREIRENHICISINGCYVKAQFTEHLLGKHGMRCLLSQPSHLERRN